VTTDHKRIGILYISTALVFFVLAGLMALVFRLQLAQANADVLGPERYNELITIHGTAMVFIVVVPLLAGFANYLVPLMIGAHDVAFPRQNALPYWPFFLRGPGIPQGEVRDTRIYLQDAMATALDLAGADAQGIDFKSVLPLVKDAGRIQYETLYGAFAAKNQREIGRAHV